MNININKKSENLENEILFTSNPKNLDTFYDLTEDSFFEGYIGYSFCVFKSINNILYLIYSNMNYSILFYNLINYNIINEIKNAHTENITNFRHHLDKHNKRDLIMSISSMDNNIKLWNAHNCNCLINIKNVNKNGCIYSGCFLYNNLSIYIITSNNNWIGKTESIKVFDLNGIKIKEINDSISDTFIIESYFDKELSKNYIISGNHGCVKSYDFNNNILYHKYNDDSYKEHLSIIMYNNKLIESSTDGYIRIWNFHSIKLLNIIKIDNIIIYNICLWNSEFLFIGCSDKKIKLLDLQSGKIIKTLIGHNNNVITIQKIYHPKYGECLISNGLCNDQIKIWLNKNIII